MILIVTACYWEAQGLIEQFHLKKVLEHSHVQQFADAKAKIRLVISGAGEIAAAAAVAGACTKYPPQKEDFLLNIGICGANAPKGSMYLIQKLTEQATGKTFYPDMLYRHPFPLEEAELVTCMLPWKQAPGQYGPDAGERSGRRLFDMEGAAVYQAGACYFAPHQMLFLKIVSDHGEGTPTSGQAVRRLMQPQQERIAAFILQLLEICDQPAQTTWKQAIEAGKEPAQMRQWIQKLCTDLHASKAMEDQLGQLIRYAVLSEADWRTVVERMYQEHKLPCRDKREGKQRFEELKQQLL